ncbi:NAD(P)-binding Rossmann-fold containing protein [Coleophoma cylindrospora]|uniref:NAD(P)-binding Rossmann-fold containing protein n=1 Tax=Coleophoma cylindrospora TaxID=1849047 RepID=A0A3D8RUV4_9HELO|nr:NAD(P)-binding Rossmann-fold containing protein [Coleophoma cylindrospora]
MSNNLQGKVIALTGGASGLGLAGSKMLAARGAKVSIADMQEGALQEAVKDIEAAGGTAMGTVVDVRDRKQVEDWISKTVEKYGKLDGAVNLAGVIGKQIGLANIEDIEDDDWKFIIDINLNGVLNCMRAEIKAMNDKGSIVNASSIAGIIGMEKNGAYIASKHAVVGLTRASAKELGPRGIRVNAIAPGPIDTPMVRKSKDTAKETDFRNIPLGREGESSEVAELLAWLLCDGSSYISGTVQSIDGGWACH